MIEARVRDFRIDSRLRKTCEGPMRELCGGMDGYDGDETDMNICLQVRNCLSQLAGMLCGEAACMPCAECPEPQEPGVPIYFARSCRTLLT